MVLGRFYFKQTINGNLLGEFSNTGMNNNSSESADITSALEEAFIGNYISTWFEQSVQSLLLEIRFKNGSNSIYTLTWTNNNGNTIFLGEGILVDGILLGDYRDDELDQRIGNQF